MKKILGSLLTISALMAVVFGASSAFFSDTETSSNNSFTAGSIDLKIDSLVNSNANNLTVDQFDAQDLGGVTIFTYADLKPGDLGDGKISINGAANDFWACTRTTNAVYDENTRLDPEVTAGDLSDDTGELQNYVKFAFWNDVDGNGHWNAGTDTTLVGPWLEGILELPWIPVGLYTTPGLVGAGWIPLADTSPAGFFSQLPLPAGSTRNLGYAYCVGNFVHTGEGVTENFTCNGAGSQNDAQGDGITSSMEFYAVQSRNNPNFTCQSLNPTPTPNPVQQ